jgi:hypothetical protein
MRRLFLLVLLAGCATPAKHPHQIDLTLLASGEVLLDGRPQRLDDIARWEHPDGARYVLDPVVLHLPEKLSFSELHPLLQALTRASRVNIALVRGSREPIVLPITLDHGCRDLWFFSGPVEVHDHSSTGPKERMWLRIRGGPGGAIRVEGVQFADVDPSDALIDEPDEKLRKGTTQDFPWSGKYPPLGAWEVKTLREFMSREDVRACRPVCTLEIRPTDRVEDVLPSLAALQSAAPVVMAELILP